ncbi:hypothetical protein SAMN05421640_3056 [Ekhidna lutea]|uniref:Uncharacterized protein n=1 Tax=Ekhidna lutea TaxID=447679 RepID=A0A239L857_EKHLU|nr:hypothetical protein [Ekhidna lutea]SNT26796.1 hypothetical protein SAMN05421640_3056 [Ekhidna lutea]
MFENLNFDEPLDENRFDQWFDEGRESKIRFEYLVVLWDEMEKDYRPVFLAERAKLKKYVDDPANVGDVFVAAYDLYTESKVM